MFILELAIILLAAKLAGDLSVRLGQPSVLGKLIVGILLGPSILGIVSGSEILQELSQIGVIILMFIAGLETDLNEFRKSAKASTFVGIGGIILPFFGGYISALLIGLPNLAALFFGLVLTATSVSISVQTLREINQLKSKEGMAILGAAVLDDIAVILLLAFLMGVSGGEEVSLSVVLLKKAVFFASAILIAWKVIPWIMNVLSRLKVTQMDVTAALIICFLFSYFAEAAGVAAIIGAYIAGIGIGSTKFQSGVLNKTENIGYALFVPIFFVSIGVSVDVGGIGSQFWLIVALSIIAVLTKLMGAGLGARLAGFDGKSAIRVGAGMISRGEVALILAALGLETGFYGTSIFSVLIIVVIITTVATPPLLKQLFKATKTAIVPKENPDTV